MDIVKVWMRKDGVKMIVIPKKSEIVEGDYVKLIKMEDNDGREERS